MSDGAGVESGHGEATTSSSLAVVGGAPAAITRRLRTRRRVQARLGNLCAVVPLLCLLAGHVLFVLLPLPTEPIRRRTYVDENALQPAQVNLFWGWDEVKVADTIAERVYQLSLASAANSTSRAEALRAMFASYGLSAFTQEYSYKVNASLFRTSASAGSATAEGHQKTISGTNTYALFRSPRTDGREAILITASWKSRWNGFDDPDIDLPGNVATRLAATGRIENIVDGAATSYDWLRRKRVNTRGVASVIALSNYLSRWLHHSKDIIFVISDGHLDGMQAWASTYFAEPPHPNVGAADEIHPSVLGRRIWTSISLDYPSDSFSAVAVLHEGTNGGSPNMDVLNTVIRVAQNLPGSSSVPVLLHGELPHSGVTAFDGRGSNELPDTAKQAAALRRICPNWIVTLLERFLWKGQDGSAAFVRATQSLLTQFRLMASGHPSGPHGLLHKYRIDAFTLYAVPARGPYGFFHMGRVVESTLRSFSNLVERLHHSQFFYLLTDPWHFIQLPTYIVVPVLLGVAITMFGLRAWRREGLEAQRGREDVAELYEAWLDEWVDAISPSSGPLKAQSQAQGGDGDSFHEVEGLLGDPSSSTTTASTLRQRAARPVTTKRSAGSISAPRRSERIRLSASPEPDSRTRITQPFALEDDGLVEGDELGRTGTYGSATRLDDSYGWDLEEDVPAERPNSSQIELRIGLRALALSERLRRSDKAIEYGSLRAAVLSPLRSALEEQDRPVWEALGLIGLAHVGAAVGVLGIVARLDSCQATGLWSCSAYRLLNTVAIAFPLGLAALAPFAIAHRASLKHTTHKAASPFPFLSPPRVPSRPNQRQRLGRLLHAFTALQAGMLIAVLSVLNFALATSFGLALAVPLCCSGVALSQPVPLPKSRRAPASASALEGQEGPRSAGITRKARLVLELVAFLLILNPSPALSLVARAGQLLGVLEPGTIEAGLEAVWVGWKVWGNVTILLVGGAYQAVVWQAAVAVVLVLSS